MWTKSGQLALSQLLLDIGSGVDTGWGIAPAGHRALLKSCWYRIRPLLGMDLQ